MHVCVCVFSSVKVYFAADTIFTRELNDGEISSIDAYFDTFPAIITRDQDVDIESSIQHFNKRITNFTKRGSGYTLSHITKLVRQMVQYRPLAGSTFVPWIERKKCIVNVCNVGNFECFKYSVLAALHPQSHNPNRRAKYEPYADELNFDDLYFPIELSKIPQFERQNPLISINVISYDEESKSFIVV